MLEQKIEKYLDTVSRGGRLNERAAKQCIESHFHVNKEIADEAVTRWKAKRQDVE